MSHSLIKNSRYQQCFGALKRKNQAAFVPFVMLADPDLETSYRIITTLIDSGADALRSEEHTSELQSRL